MLVVIEKMPLFFNLLKIRTFVAMTDRFVNIHTHRPTGRGIELRTAGIHPWNADKEDVSTIVPSLGEVQAVGETGLDFVLGADRAVQLAAFRAQLALAHERQMPVVLHCVRAFEPLMRELAAYTLPGVIFHGFIGSPRQGQRALDAGCFFSFGLRSFRSPRTVAALRATPEDRLFCETDDGPEPIGAVYARMAALRGAEPEALRRRLWENYERLFAKQ